MTLTKQLTNYWRKQLAHDMDIETNNWINLKRQLHKKQGNHVARITVNGRLISHLKLERHQTKVHYLLRVTFLVRQASFFYHEEQICKHESLFNKGKIVEDRVVNQQNSFSKNKIILDVNEQSKESNTERFNYDRRAAVHYAERWWDDYNPAYRHFDVDCTNFVSQVLYAGGAPMRGYPNRGEGWWYQANNWSYSWAVAHSLRWYLSGSTQGLRGKEVEDPTQLLPGDVICYDFEGDGKWDHNTIVVMKDQNNMPLVNAHTNNSRHRYWSYEDSYAWTSNCQYKFFQIGTS